jgi:hypothetical protein
MKPAGMAGGRKPAQPSIPEGILDFPSPDARLCRTFQTKAKLLKANGAIWASRAKIPRGQ